MNNIRPVTRNSQSGNRSRYFARALTGLGIALALTAPTMLPAQAKPKPPEAPIVRVAPGRATERVMVMPFGGPGTWRDGEWAAIGAQVANMVTTALMNRGVAVVDRATLSAQQREMENDLTGAMNSSTVAKFGKTSGAKVILTGTVTEFAVEGKSFGVSIFRKNKQTARVKIDAHLTSIETSDMLGGSFGEGTDATGGFSLNIGIGVDWQDGNWIQGTMGKAARAAVEDMINKMVPMIPMRNESNVPNGVNGGAAAPAVDGSTPGMAALRDMTCVVLIPETHITRIRVPDPAAETEITRQLLAAGIKVKDDARLHQLRDEKWVLEALHGNADPVHLQELRNNYGADILIVGEGLSERAEKDVLGSNAVICRGRVEVKAIRMDTGAIIAADDDQQAGRDLSEILSAKNALKNAAAAVVPRLIAAMAQNLAHGAASTENGTVTMELEISGLASLSYANQFITELGKLPGVTKVKRGAWKGGVLFGTATVTRDGANDLGLWLEENAAMKKFNLQVQDSSAAKVSARVK
jgi:curli biogenesis system outer membrane secretion channel CsgG/nucleotide-binding universal stress UspA family protein